MESWIKYEKRFILGNKFDSVKFQIMVYTFSENIHITLGHLNLLTHFAINGISKESIKTALENKIFKSKFSLGNAITFLLQKGLIEVEKNKNKIISPKMDLVVNDYLLGNFKIINLNK